MLQGASALQTLQVRKALLVLRGNKRTLAVYGTRWKHPPGTSHDHALSCRLQQAG